MCLLNCFPWIDPSRTTVPVPRHLERCCLAHVRTVWASNRSWKTIKQFPKPLDMVILQQTCSQSLGARLYLNLSNHRVLLNKLRQRPQIANTNPWAAAQSTPCSGTSNKVPCNCFSPWTKILKIAWHPVNKPYQIIRKALKKKHTRHRDTHYFDSPCSGTNTLSKALHSHLHARSNAYTPLTAP